MTGLKKKNLADFSSVFPGFFIIIITSKLLMRCTDNFVIFYVRWFWIILYIYYKEKVK